MEKVTEGRNFASGLGPEELHFGLCELQNFGRSPLKKFGESGGEKKGT